MRINPLELDLDIVTGALSGPFARKHGLVAIAKTDEKLDQLATFDVFRHVAKKDMVNYFVGKR